MDVASFLLAAMIGYLVNGAVGACVGAGVGWFVAAFLTFRANVSAEDRLSTLESAAGNIESYVGEIQTKLDSLERRLAKQDSLPALLNSIDHSVRGMEAGLQRLGIPFEPLSPGTMVEITGPMLIKSGQLTTGTRGQVVAALNGGNAYDVQFPDHSVTLRLWHEFLRVV